MSAVLILAYRRWQNIHLILEQCRLAGVPRIYFHVDCGVTEIEKADVQRTIDVASDYKKRWELDIRIATQEQNIGCAVSMISSLNTIFQDEKQLTVLEDDCIPTLDFFYFMDASFREMEKNPKISIACGAQFAPSNVTQGDWLLSRYPFNWGWGISKNHWKLLFATIHEDNSLKTVESQITRTECCYWNAGSRRALNGYTDVWDTLLVREMIRLNSLAVLPGVNLVKNIGNDDHALHTQGEQEWINFSTGKFLGHSNVPNFHSGFDEWARSEFYKISKRHYFSTKITWFLDTFLRKPKRRPLKQRIQFAKVSFDL